MSPFLSKKHVFEGKKHVFLTKNGLINVGLMSIKLSNMERQPLVVHGVCCSYSKLSKGRSHEHWNAMAQEHATISGNISLSGC